MLLSLFRAEVFKLSRRTMTRVLLLLLVLGTIGLYMLLWLVSRSTPQNASPETLRSLEDLRQSLRLEEVRATGLDSARGFASVLAIIMAVVTISSEYTAGTIRLMLPRAGSRIRFLTAKYLYLLAFVALLVVLGYIAALIASLVVSSAEGLDRSVSGRFVPLSIVAMARTAYVILPYLAIAFFVAVLTRSTAAGITVGLVVLFGESLGASLIALLPSPLDRLPEALLSRNVGAVIHTNQLPSNDLPPDLPNPWRAAAILLAYIVIFVGLAYRRFLTRDVTTGGE